MDDEDALEGLARRDPRRPSRRRSRAARSRRRYGHRARHREGQGGELNVGPALSPDGARLAFLSERDLFSIELFVADARTGEVDAAAVADRRRSPPGEPAVHQLGRARGTATAQRVALGAVSKGRPLLVILDARHGRARCSEMPFPTLGEIYTPSFSPDGKRVVFAALVGGLHRPLRLRPRSRQRCGG